MKIFYVCSWGGSGSITLCRYLNQFGKAVHIHDPNPPNKLEYVGFKNKRWGWCPIDLPEYEEKYKNIYNRGLEWFSGVEIFNNDKNEYFVIYLYRNPVESIKSRFSDPNHLQNIKSPIVTMKDVCNQKTDLYNLETFYKNYMEKKDKNYKIYAIKFEELFDKIEELDLLLGINQNKQIKFPDKTKRKDRGPEYINDLTNVYQNLIDKMNKNKFIIII